MSFSFKKFQREDYARLALCDGGILAHDTGGGKGIALLVWPALKLGFHQASTNEECRMKNEETDGSGATGRSGNSSFIIHHSSFEGLRPKGAVLIVAPGDLHRQIITEAREKFRATVTPIPDQATFLRLAQHVPNAECRMKNEETTGADVPTEGDSSFIIHHSSFPGSRLRLPDGYYITSYTQLATNGVQDFPETCDPKAVSWDLVREYHSARGTMLKGAYNLFHVSPDCSAAELQRAHHSSHSSYQSHKVLEALDTAYDRLRHFHGPRSADFDGLSHTQHEALRQMCAAHLHKEHAENIGEERWSIPRKAEGQRLKAETTDAAAPEGSDTSAFSLQPSAFLSERRIKCVYSPSLADLCVDTFDCVVVDEGVRMKGEETLIGKGLRRLCPRYRLVLTATPVKNRLPDIFRLAWWAAGGLRLPHARFPYADDASDRDAFAEEFLITEHLLADKDKGKPSRRRSGNASRESNPSYSRVKRTPQVCNIHRLWKLFGPVVLRRPKREFGEDIVKKHRHVIRVPMGKMQAEVYHYHLEADYKDEGGMPAIMSQLLSLRMAASCPCSTNLNPVK